MFSTTLCRLIDFYFHGVFYVTDTNTGSLRPEVYIERSTERTGAYTTIKNKVPSESDEL